jgi:arylsulfatase A-like enzyme
MVEALDSEIGRLLRSVDVATTTVIFVGDNGTSSGVIARPYPRAKAKGTVYEGGVRAPLLIAGAGVANKGRIVPINHKMHHVKHSSIYLEERSCQK